MTRSKAMPFGSWASMKARAPGFVSVRELGASQDRGAGSACLTTACRTLRGCHAMLLPRLSAAGCCSPARDSSVIIARSAARRRCSSRKVRPRGLEIVTQALGGEQLLHAGVGDPDVVDAAADRAAILDGLVEAREERLAHARIHLEAEQLRFDAGADDLRVLAIQPDEDRRQVDLAILADAPAPRRPRCARARARGRPRRSHWRTDRARESGLPALDVFRARARVSARCATTRLSITGRRRVCPIMRPPPVLDRRRCGAGDSLASRRRLRR
jgi:hypothetical protein